MNARIKKLVGSLALLVGLFVYIVLALQIGAILPHLVYIELPFYILAGTVWVFPAIRIIRWMHV